MVSVQRFCAFSFSAILGLAAALTSAHAQDATKNQVLNFGVLPYLNTRTLMTTYQPVAAFLEQELKRPVSLSTAPALDTFAKRTFAGDFDLAIIPPHFGRIAEVDYGFTHLLSYRTDNEALLVTTTNAPLRSLQDLRGKSVSTIDRSAFIGILAAQWFTDHGLGEKDVQFVDGGNHSNAMQLAVAGKTRAAIVWRTILQKSPPELQKEVITFGDVLFTAPSYSYIVHKRVPQSERKAIKEALLRFEKSEQGRVFFEGVAHGGYREPSAADAKLSDRILPETRRLLGIAH